MCGMRIGRRRVSAHACRCAAHACRHEAVSLHMPAQEEKGCIVVASECACTGFQPGQGMTCPLSALTLLYGDTRTLLSLPSCKSFGKVSTCHCRMQDTSSAHWLKWQDSTAVQEYADHLPGALAQDPSQLGAWLYSCSSASHDEAAAISRTMPHLSLQVLNLHCSCNSAALVFAVQMVIAYHDSVWCLSR